MKGARVSNRRAFHTSLDISTLRIIDRFVDDGYGFQHKNDVIEVAVELLDATVGKVSDDPEYFSKTLTCNERKLIVIDILRKRRDLRSN